MDAFISPFITILANIIADVLVSKGIIDAGSKQVVIQNVNTIAAALMTMVVAVVTVIKAVDLAKHKITASASTQSVTPVSQQFSQQTTPTVNGQIGNTNLPQNQ